jgi:transcriptional regulator with XRE-family HTH domain
MSAFATKPGFAVAMTGDEFDRGSARVSVFLHCSDGWAKANLEVVSAVVNGSALGRTRMILSNPTWQYLWTPEGVVIYADADAPSSAIVDRTDDKPETVLPRHAEIARELRDMSGLSAALLGDGFGVSREQYQRWMSGSPISDIRYGQVMFLHTIARELLRKVGEEGGRLWWQTPGPDGVLPKSLVQQRLLDRVHRLVMAENDALGHGGPSLLAASVDAIGLADGVDEDEDPWSPYEAD